MKRFIEWLKCLFAHNWLYCSETPVNGEWHRECRRCGKREHGEYDMMYGTTSWHNGWK